MQVVALKSLRDFGTAHPDAEQPADVKKPFGNARILKNRRVVLNIKGDDWRVVAALAYSTGVVFVKFVGTHRAYDSIDADTLELE